MGKHLTIKERYYIEISLKKKVPVKQIAEDLGKSLSCIYSEIRKGKCIQRDRYLKERKIYLADYAQRRAESSWKNKSHRKLACDDEWLSDLRDLILNKKYSPYAALVRCGSKVCEKTVYNYIHQGFIPGLKVTNLPYAKQRIRKTKRIVPYTKGLSIDERPEHINDRSVYGHWEGDTVYSSKDDRACLLTLTERKSREERIIPLPDRKAGSVLQAFDRLERSMGTETFRKTFQSITFDNGSEFALWRDIERCCRSRKKRTTVYFAHPYRSGERGTNENHNRMIRRWIPKGDDIGLYSPEEIQAIEDWINDYPRRMFGGRSSREAQGGTG